MPSLHDWMTFRDIKGRLSAVSAVGRFHGLGNNAVSLWELHKIAAAQDDMNSQRPLHKQGGNSHSLQLAAFATHPLANNHVLAYAIVVQSLLFRHRDFRTAMGGDGPYLLQLPLNPSKTTPVPHGKGLGTSRQAGPTNLNPIPKLGGIINHHAPCAKFPPEASP